MVFPTQRGHRIRPLESNQVSQRNFYSQTVDDMNPLERFNIRPSVPSEAEPNKFLFDVLAMVIDSQDLPGLKRIKRVNDLGGGYLALRRRKMIHDDLQGLR